MKLLIIADIHSYFLQLDKILKEVEFDLLLLAGDLTHYKGSDVTKIDEIVSRYTDECFAVHGNCDPEHILRTELDTIRFIHATSIKLSENITLHGVGGSTFTPFNTPTEYSEDEMERFISMLKITDGLNLLLSHSPPRNMVDVTMSGENAGSKALMKHAKKFSFIMCGHIHEASGVDRKGRTIAVNPGPAAWGRYAVAEVDNSEVRSVRVFRL
jgi:hypothetical protein